MRPLSAQDLLDIWERGEAQHPVDRALTLLAAALPERPSADVRALSIGQRDALILALREHTFGPRLDGVATCPQCHADLECTLDVAALRTAQVAEPLEAARTLTVEGVTIECRVPNSQDLAVMAHCEDVATARRC
jgi:hypothetical protein